MSSVRYNFVPPVFGHLAPLEFVSTTGLRGHPVAAASCCSGVPAMASCCRGILTTVPVTAESLQRYLATAISCVTPISIAPKSVPQQCAKKRRPCSFRCRGARCAVPLCFGWARRKLITPITLITACFPSQLRRRSHLSSTPLTRTIRRKLPRPFKACSLSQLPGAFPRRVSG